MTNAEELNKLTDAELTDIADAHGIDLVGTESRQELIDKIVAAGVGQHPVGADEEEDLSGDDQ